MKNTESFTSCAREAITKAQSTASAFGHASVGTEHLLLGISGEGTGMGSRALREAGLSFAFLEQQLVNQCGRGTPGNPALGLGEDAVSAIGRAAEDARRLGRAYIGTEHLLLGILRDPDCLGCALIRAGGVAINDLDGGW